MMVGMPGCALPVSFEHPRTYARLLAAALLLTTLLSGCVPGAVERQPQINVPAAEYRPVTVEEAARALEFAELEFLLASSVAGGGEQLSPLSGLILPAYRHVIPEMKLRSSPSTFSDDASYRQIYYWGLQPLDFDRLSLGDIVLYSDAAEAAGGAGLFAGWKSSHAFRMLIVDEAAAEASYVEWSLSEDSEERRLLAVGRLMVAVPHR